MELLVRVASLAGRQVVSVIGEIDLATIPQLHNALTRAIADSIDVIVDLDGVYACDDAALGVLLGAAGRARESGATLSVVRAGGAFRDRLARTGFDRAVTVHPTLDVALDQTQE